MPLNREEKKEIERRIGRSAAFQRVFRGVDGELVHEEVMKFAGMKNDTFSRDPCEAAYNAGRRSVAIFIENCINQNIAEVREALKKDAEDTS